MTSNAGEDYPPLSSWARAGHWLFRQRTWIPLPLVLTLLLVRKGEAPSRLLTLLGATIVLAAEALRVWAVRHIGVISRTRSDRLGPLVCTGPFAIVRNPLYLGNIGLWVGFALAARLVWVAPIFAAVLGLEYHAIVRWEEQALESRRGEDYRAYARRVPRWIPAFHRASSTTSPAAHSWRDTLFSERGTLTAIGVGSLLLWMKATLFSVFGG